MSALSVYENKLSVLKELHQKIKKRKLFLDESKAEFGFRVKTLVEIEDVRNTDDIKGYPLLLKLPNDYPKIVLKVVPIECKYNKQEHPVFLETLTLKYLTEDLLLNYISPNITYYIYDFKASNRSKSLSFLNLKIYEKRELIKANSNILVSEYVTGGNLGEWVYNKYNKEKEEEIGDSVWKSIVFQLIYTIFVFGDKYKMMHNDFHYGNILIDDTYTKGYFEFSLCKGTDGKSTTWYIPHNGIIPKIWDFEFAMVYSNKIKDVYPNQFILGSLKYDKKAHVSIETSDISESDLQNVPVQYNNVYDLHYFLTSLLELYVSKELFDWILSLYPEELIPPDPNSTDTTTMTSKTSSTTNSTTSKTSTISKTSKTSKISTTSKTSETSKTSKTSKTSETSSTTKKSTEFLREGRLINGVEKKFKLPIPITLLESDFFSDFKKMPSDYNSSEITKFSYTCM